MKKVWKKLSKAIRHNVPLVAAICLASVVLFWGVSCQSTTQSLLEPALKVNRAALKYEYESELLRLEHELTQLQKLVTLREQDLDRQDTFKQELFDIGVIIAKEGQVNPIGIVTTLLAVVAGGSLANGVVKDRIIKTNNKNNKKT